MKKAIQLFSLKIKKHIFVLYEVNKHPKTPKSAKIIIMIALGYALSPIDLIPDFIPVLGYLDDLIILPMLIYLALRFIPSEIWNDCVIKAEQNENKLPKIWLVGGLIILIWVSILIYLLVKIFQ